LRRGEDISLFAIVIMKQGDPGRSIGIVFDRGDFSRDLPFVSLEIDDAILSFVTPSPMPGGDPSITVSSPRPFYRTKKTSLRCYRGDFLKLGDGLKPLSGRSRSEFLNGHGEPL
jgi:hypothetical protein